MILTEETKEFNTHISTVLPNPNQPINTIDLTAAFYTVGYFITYVFRKGLDNKSSLTLTVNHIANLYNI